jgi:glutamate dehydrogenase
LLTEVTPDITRRVLGHNSSQACALSLDQLRSQTRLADFRDLMAQLEAEGFLDRRFEHLPERETLRNRRGQFLGLTRPELAVLLAHSKLALQHHLLVSNLADDPFYEPYLRCYFPDVVDARFGQSVRSHRLRREIIAVEVANAAIDIMGTSFVTRVGRDTGAGAGAVIRAWSVAMAVSGADEIWDAVMEADPPLPPATEARCWFALETAIERATKWIIETQPPDQPAADLSDTLAGSTRELLQILQAVLPAATREQLSATTESLAADGTPRPLALRIVSLDQLAELFEIAHIARELDVAHRMTAEVYYRVGEVVDLDWVRRSLADQLAEDRWERRAIEGLNAGLMYARRQLTHNILLCRQGGEAVDACLQEYIETNREQLAKVAALVNDIKSARHASLAALLVVMRELGRLAGTRA